MDQPAHLGAVGRAARRLREWAALVGLTVIPLQCAGCGRDDYRLCAACLLEMSRAPARCEGGAVRLVDAWGRTLVPVWARAWYAGTTREVILGWKARGRRDLDALLARQLAGAAQALAPAFACGQRRSTLWIMPIPSTRRAIRKRGSDLVADLALAVATALTEVGVDARVAHVLRRRGRRHQAGLSLAGRSANRRATLRARGQVPQGRVVFVDDIVTTGASLRQAAQFVASRGGEPVAALVIAATPRPQMGSGRECP